MQNNNSDLSIKQIRFPQTTLKQITPKQQKNNRDS